MNSDLPFHPWLDTILTLGLIFGPAVILERISTWLGVWDVPDDINPPAQ